MNNKNNEKIIDKYMQNGGCLPSPLDERDYTLDTLSLSAGDLPEEFLVKGMTILNQGTIGSCVAHACATSMGYGELKTGKVVAHDFSRGYIYGNRNEDDYQGEGMYIRQALKQLNHCGDCELIDFPYNETYPQVKLRIQQRKEELAKKAESFKILNYFRCYSEKEVKIALMNQGAVILSIPLYSSFSGKCPLPKETDQYKGNHAMCLIGWNKDGWIIQNSWGKSWGEKGLLYLPYDYPVNEFWGITVSPVLPEPKRSGVWDKIKYFFKWIFGQLKNIFK